MRTESCGQTPKVRSVLHRDQLMHICSDDLEVVQEVVADFVQKAPAALLGLGTAVDSRDSRQIRFAAHELKGSCATIGAEALASVCEALEMCGRANELSTVNSLFVTAQYEYSRLHPFLSEYLPEQST